MGGGNCHSGKIEDWVSLFTGLDYWTGLQLQPPKAIVSPHLKQWGTNLVQCNLSIVATPQHQTNCREVA